MLEGLSRMTHSAYRPVIDLECVTHGRVQTHISSLRV